MITNVQNKTCIAKAVWYLPENTRELARDEPKENTMNVKGWYGQIAREIEKEDRQRISATERKDRLLAIWEFHDKSASPLSILERGKHVAANLRGTPYADCMRAKSLMDDLEWLISKLSK